MDKHTTRHSRTKTLTPVGLPGWRLEVEVACLGRCQPLSDSATCLSPFRDQSGTGCPLHHPGRLMNRQARLARERQVPCRRTTDRACSALDDHRSSRMTMHSQPSSGSAAQASSIFRPQHSHQPRQNDMSSHSLFVVISAANAEGVGPRRRSVVGCPSQQAGRQCPSDGPRISQCR